MGAARCDPGVVGFTFRRVDRADLPMLHAWLNEPGIVRWWEGDDVSWDAVRRDYVEDESAEHWIASLDGTAVGWIQCWAVADEPGECEQWHALGIQRTAAGMDYLLGDPARRNRGVGSAMLRAFVADVVFGLHPGYTQACAAPYTANEASWKALRRAGLRFAGTVMDKDGPCNLMVVDRADDVARAEPAEAG